MPNFCAAPNCTRKSTQSDLAFFRFPRDPSRCQKWVENCRRYDLEDKTPDQLNKHYRLCAQHFEDSMICRSSPYRTVLRENAIPTIFDLTSHLGNPGRRRKRIKELSEEEIRTLKERKRTEMVFGLHHSFLMASKSFLDIELLIALVRLHPELYDPHHSSYNDTATRGTIWNQIASEIFMDWDDLNPQQRSMKAREVQTQWQSLKENFRQELSKQTRQELSPLDAEKPTFSHFNELLFLQPLMVIDENAVQPPTAARRRDKGVDEKTVQPPTAANWRDEEEDEKAVQPPTAAKWRDEEEDENAFHPPTAVKWRDEEEDENTFHPPTAVKWRDEEEAVQVVYIKEEPPSPPQFTETESDASGPTHDVIDPQPTHDVIDPQHLQEGLRIEGTKAEDHNDFAQSLVPYLAQVPDSHQESLRMALTNLIFCYIENTQGHVPAVSPQLRRYISSQDDPSP